MYMVPFWLIVRVVVDVALLNVRGVVWMVILLTELTLKTRNVPAGTVMSSKPWNVSVMFPEEDDVGVELSMGTVHVSPTLTSERFSIPVMKGLAVALSVVSAPWKAFMVYPCLLIFWVKLVFAGEMGVLPLNT